MNRFSSLRIFNEANSIIAAWTHNHSAIRLKKVNIEEIARTYGDQFICLYSLENAHKVTLEIWRRYRHVLPVKGDVKTANIKRMINAVRRHMAQAKRDRTNINKAVKASTETLPVCSRDFLKGQSQ